MKAKNWRTYTFWIVLSEAAGLLSGILSRSGAQAFGGTVQQPSLTPPAFLFPIVWTVLYALMGIGAARIGLAPQFPQRSRSLNLFVTQLIVNFFWSLIFFNAQAYGFAFLWLILLWILVLWMTVSFWRVDRIASVLQIPYLLWLTFAAYLSYGVWSLNS